ncbi:hypothetical protein [uncultured Desulfosarcina sp.]|uniref:hypothetical protein n=1 Tax=uncultured Desulfosarcina sp. TaxID=218289 RepID=UPI0029C9583C|nr:hypothetical protein [uncultured Desulfosarcina sp.]
MLHVSFAKTGEAYDDRSKTETRRFWKDSHAAKFKPGTEFMGITKDFRAGGKRMHASKVIFCRKERLGDMSEDSFRREGGTRYWKTARLTSMPWAGRILCRGCCDLNTFDSGGVRSL